ncbi:hypothetical protein PHYSODRAFT_295355 [Phytophthora sojae]|uniref:Uncharacterized protein n=1 Tax=Phytophthora sojae (strain P6497) TaxID=1094619 RepID=G4YQX9_PHYSP|nr:hypothetical protein PHYSODRAFT_295355 [Phytophthora sojae]EGZ30607.1 hypothetical protein PHYSODRAFT_295355 [Phytophthora sojae]|eukprot:XP_009517882.1 hypothetical protein PHYSODRAFT_295355 [Phytophthora sojae]
METADMDKMNKRARRPLIRKEVEEWVATAKKEGLYGHRDGGLYPDDHGNLMAVVNKFVKFGVSWESIGRITNAPISFRTNRKIKSGVTYTLHVGYLCFFFQISTGLSTRQVMA